MSGVLWAVILIGLALAFSFGLGTFVGWNLCMHRVAKLVEAGALLWPH